MRELQFLPFVIVILLLLPACNDFLEVVQPKDNIPISEVFQTEEDLVSALNGVYHIMQSPAIAGLNLLLYGDLLSQNGSFTISGFPEEFDIAQQTMRSSNFQVEQTWVKAYEAINLINSTLEAIEKVKGLSKGDIIRGECLFLRAILYFELVRLYGTPYSLGSEKLGVPLVTTPVLESSTLAFPERATVAAIYTQIEQDLSTAQNLLPLTQPKDRANPAAVVAYQARVAFQKEDFSSVLVYTQDLFDNYGLSLTETPNDFFTNENNSELIWTINYTANDPNNNGKSVWFHENQDRIKISPALKLAFQQIITASQQQALSAENLQVIDLRTDFGMTSNSPLVSANLNYTNKYEDAGGNADDTPMARLSEFYLMAAEALARTEGVTEQNIQLLNAIRQRSLRGFDAAGNEINSTQFLDRVLYKVEDFSDTNGLDKFIETLTVERRVELCFEGNYLHDLVRLKQTVNGIPYDDCRLRLPIPQREMDVNTNLVQNGACY